MAVSTSEAEVRVEPDVPANDDQRVAPEVLADLGEVVVSMAMMAVSDLNRWTD